MIELANLVRPNILNLSPYASARAEYSERKGVFLDANENPFGELNRYPDPQQKELKQKLAERKDCAINNIFIGNGSDEVIDLAFRIFCTPGQDKALTFSPSYGMYDVSAAINDIELLKIPLDSDFQIDLERTKTYLSDDRLKLIFICSPNNPTGNLLDREAIHYILQHFNGIVMIDEAYIDFAKEDSFIQFINQYNNLIVSQTFSKAWGLAAARVGIGYADPALIALYNKVKPPYNVSAINQEAALKALEDLENFNENMQQIVQEKIRLMSSFESIQLVKRVYPSDANFLLVEVENAINVYQYLIEKKVIVRNRSSLIDNCIRITVGSSDDNNQLLNALKNMP